MQNIVPKTVLMSSVEIAKLTKKEHRNVTRDIRSMLDALGKDALNFEHTFLDSCNRKQSCFVLPYEETICLLSGYDAKMRMIVIQRWQELELAQTNDLIAAIPKTYAGALRLAADLQDKVDSQAVELEAAQPAIAFVGRYVEAKSAKGFREVAKILGLKERDFILTLREHGIIFKQGHNWLPMAKYQHSGYFEVKTGESNGHAYIQTRFTPAGIAWVADRVAKKQALVSLAQEELI